MTQNRLDIEAQRQGETYSQLVKEDYESFFKYPLLAYGQTERAKWAVSHLRQHPELVSPWRVLDGGCGIGTTALYFAREAGNELGHLRAVDMSKEAIRVANELLKKEPAALRSKVTLEQGNFFHQGGGPYHLVYLHQVYEHIPDEDAIFQKVSELLVPGGLFVISTPNRDRLMNRLLAWKGRPPALMDPLHLKEFTMEELCQPRPGFKVVGKSGRMVGDEDSLTMVMSLSLKPIRPLVRPIASRLAQSRQFFDWGRIAPTWSWDLWVAWQKI